MRAIDRFSLATSIQKDRRAVLKGPERVPVAEVDGIVLDAQFELDDGSKLIWLTDDSPYDEGLHIYLLGRDDIPEDSVEAGAVFAGGILKFREIGSRWVDFAFFLNSKVYRLEVQERPRFRLRLPTGWKYKNLLKAHRLVIFEAKEEGGGNVR
jgi:hypothetical protein